MDAIEERYGRVRSRTEALLSPLSPEDSALVASLSPVAKSPAIPSDEEEGGVGAGEQRLMLDSMPSMWPVKGYITKEFSVTGGEKSPDYHPGMDIAAARNTPVVVAADGVVEASVFDDVYGWMVEVDHGYGIRSVWTQLPQSGKHR